ncbi:neuronal acetylcholine receptor subunit eat-2 [Malaya genurostris]|uniref:neuronal acetylcholine receptor subunit eat-2 n=1 Tax=Malaya genurostris TaxID=325434 RepID=UPI0026F3F595|nr:neuronal acetylcholine receptor subunit eat-2 [Malaya genurostris]
MWFYSLLVIFQLFSFGYTESKYNVTYADLDKCKQYNAVNGYNYHAFFKLEELENHSLDNETLVNLRLFVVAAKDAHILLSDLDSSSNDAQVYEIVIGAGANTFSEIRKQRKKNPLKTKTTKGVLSPIDPLPLRIRITKEGLIEVGIEGQSLPLMSATDKNIIAVRYLSFSSWGSTQAKWFYDCPSDDETETQLEEFDPVKNMTSMAKLLYELQMNVSFDPPKWYSPIQLKKLVFTRVAYHSWKNTLETRAITRLSWYDNRTTWVPQEHGNITKVIGFQYLMWTPTLVAKDEAESVTLELLGIDHMSFSYDGNFEFISREISTETYCSLRESPDWPYETNECDLVLSTETNLSPLKMTSEAVSFHPNMIQSDWNVMKITKHENINNNELFALHDGSPRHETILRFHLKRNNEFYDTVLYAPYFMSNVMILLSFWLEGMLRIWANGFGIIILIASFLQISGYAPQTSDPTIFKFFRYSLVCSWLCVALFVLDKWLRVCGPRMAPDSWLVRFISYPYLRVFLRLDGSSNYDNLHRKNLECRDFAKVLDRFVFLIMGGIFAASCFKKV